MQDYPKRIKRILRELAGEAYELEMTSEMAQLDESFGQWRSGKIGVWELHRRIHKYHNGPARDLFNMYSAPSQADMLVAYAIVRGVLAEDRIPEELWPYLERQLAFYHRLEEREQAGSSPQEVGDEEG